MNPTEKAMSRTPRHHTRRKRHFRLLRRVVVLLMLFLLLVLLVDLIEYQPQSMMQPSPAAPPAAAPAQPDAQRVAPVPARALDADELGVAPEAAGSP